MSKAKETRADILREMRTYFQTQKRNGNPEHRTWHQVLSDWADRIDAAVKREKAATEAEALKVGGLVEATRHKQVGNAAAMREALKNVLGICANCTCSAAVCDRACNPGIAGKTIEKARAALSAPARNCDRYGDEDDAFAAWHDALNDGDVVSVRNAFRWLFAKATEEGESNGSK